MDFLEKYKALGYSFFNTGSRLKKVTTPWTQYQQRKPSESEIKIWRKFAPDFQNYAIVCGQISNLIVFDVDTKNGADPSPFQNRGFYEVRTPSGGYHFYCLYDPILKATKHKKAKDKTILHAVDVQTNGALVFAPPSKFPQGTYTVVHDTPLIPCPDDLLATIVEALEPEQETKEYTPFKPIQNPEMGRPGDIFNANASWEDVLYPAGWTKVSERSNGVTYWRRPGKTDGISASTNWKGYDLFFPYSTSVGLDEKKGYTKFRLYTELNHGGDFRIAAKSLVMDNYKRVINNTRESL